MNQTLIGAILSECNRLRDTVLPEYDKIPEGKLAATLMRQAIKEGEEAVASGDAVECVSALQKLRSYQL